MIFCSVFENICWHQFLPAAYICANFSTFWHNLCNTLQKWFLYFKIFIHFLNSQVKCFLKFIIQAKFIYRCHVYEIFWICAKKSAKIANTKIGKNSCFAKLVEKLRVAALSVLEMFPGFWSNIWKCIRPFMKSLLRRVYLILIIW